MAKGMSNKGGGFGPVPPGNRSGGGDGKGGGREREFRPLAINKASVMSDLRQIKLIR